MIDTLSLIRLRLNNYQRRVWEDARMTRAAVLVPLFAEGGDASLLFTRRTESVEHHKGQISFPGGMADKEDSSLLATALRETEEELGIRRAEVQVLGTLDDVPTYVSGFVITPVVGMIPYPIDLRVNAAEISEVLTVPLAIFRDPGRLRTEERERDGHRATIYFYSYGAYEIWGATARIVKGFVDTVFGPA